MQLVQLSAALYDEEFVEHVDGKRGSIEDLKCEEVEEAIELHKCEGADLEEVSEDEQRFMRSSMMRRVHAMCLPVQAVKNSTCTCSSSGKSMPIRKSIPSF